MAITPFRVAFWSMLFGILLTSLLAIPTSRGMILAMPGNPQMPGDRPGESSLVNLRTESAVPVIHPPLIDQMPPPTLSGEPSIAADSGSPTPQETGKPVPDPYFPLPEPRPEPEPTPARMVPVQVASAASRMSLGLKEGAPAATTPMPVPLPIESTLPTSSGVSPEPFPAAITADSATPREPLTISVPAPRQPESATAPTNAAGGELHDALATLRNGLLELQVQELKRDMQRTQQGVENLQRDQWLEEIRGIKSEIEQIRDQVNRPVAAEKLTSAKETHEPIQESTVATAAAETPEPSPSSGRPTDSQTILIQDGRVAGTKSFEFRDASIPDVLKTLGEYSGWTVVIHPEVTGTYTGEFPNADPDQAFVVAVKLFDCVISPRGTYALVGRRTAHPSR